MQTQTSGLSFPEKLQKIGEAISARDFRALEAWLVEYKKPRGLGALARAMDNKGPSALLCDAAAAGWVEAVRLLLPEADLLYAMAASDNDKERARLGRDGNDLSGIKAESGVLYTALGFACVNGRVECARVLLDSVREEERQASSDPQGGKGRSAAIPCRRLVKFIYGSYGSDLALHFAAERGLHVAVETLVEVGEALNEEDRSGMTALFASVASKPGKGAEQQRAREEVIRKLCAMGADVNKRCGEKGKTALVLAVEQEDLGVAKILLEAGACAKVEMKGGQTCLGIVASGLASEMRAALAVELLRHGAYPWRAPHGGGPWQSPLAAALAGRSANVAKSIALAAETALDEPSCDPLLLAETWGGEIKLASEAGIEEVAQILRRVKMRQEEACSERREQERASAAKKTDEERSANAQSAIKEIRALASGGAAGVEAAIEKIQERLLAIEAETKALREMIVDMSGASHGPIKPGAENGLPSSRAEEARGRLSIAAASQGVSAPSRRVVHEAKKPG